MIHKLNATVYPASGFFDPNDHNTSHTVTIQLGTYNDHGGSDHQKMRKTSLLGFVLAPGQSADAVVAMYGSSNGGFFDHLANALKTNGPTIVGAVLAGSVTIWRHRNEYRNFLACVALSGADSDCATARMHRWNYSFRCLWRES